MIKSISIKNFQSHKDTRIDFCDGLNVISGSSDSGKSSIIRAIRWVTENRPAGDSIKNWYSKKEDKVSVKIDLGNCSVEKEREGSKTKYILNTNSSAKEFEALRSDVPEEVSEVFGLSDFNLQTQHDPYFLLNDSPGEVARKLNSLVGLDIIDVIFKNLNSKITSTKRNIEENSSLEESINTQIENLNWIDLADRQLAEIEKEQFNLLIKKKKFEEISRLSERAEYLKHQIKELQPIIKKEKDTQALLGLLDKLKSDREKWNRVCHIAENINELRLKTKESIPEEVVYSVNDFKKHLEEHISEKEKYDEVSYQTELIKRLKIDRKEQTKIKESKQKDLENTLSKSKICPLCGSILDTSRIKEML